MSSDQHLIAASLWTGEPDKGRVYHHADLSDADRVRLHGSVSIDIPPQLIAGQSVDVRFTITIGETALDPGATLRIAWRWPFDWSDLQQDDASRSNHLSVAAPPDVELETRYEHRGDLNPWHHDIDLRVTSGTLSTGDTIEVVCTGWDGPTFTTDDGYFLVAVSPDGSHDWHRLVDVPRFSIVAGPADRLIAIAPADGFVGEQTLVRVRAVDAWENATPIDPPHLTCEGADIGQPTACPRYPVWEYPITWTAPGVHRVSALADGFSCTSNPTRVTDSEPERRLYWGDLHAGQSEIGCGAGSLDHHYAYARDVAALQFASQQANDHYVTTAIWNHVREVTPRHDVEGEFLAYLGCEWSPYTEDGGDRNVIYMTDESRMRRSDRFFREHEPDPEPDLNRAPEFLNVFREEDVLLNLHVGGRPTNLEWHAPEIEPLFEVHSTHATSEWFLFDALRRGYKVGITAGTDGVMGRPGACGSGRRVTRNVRNGLTAVSAAGLTQRAVRDGFFARHCYGTTGARILLDVRCGDRPMGSTVTGLPEFTVAAEGTAGIERIDFFRGTDLLESRLLADPDPSRLRILFGGAREIGTAAAQRQNWDGSLEISDGTVNDIEPVGFQCPLNTVETSGSTVSWQITTAGNDTGFAFTLDGENAAIAVTTEPCTFDANLADVVKQPLRVEAGGVDRRVEFGPAPSPDTSLSATERFTDPEPPSGEHAYWFRITQTDRHRAWSSPIYVTT